MNETELAALKDVREGAQILCEAISVIATRLDDLGARLERLEGQAVVDQASRIVNGEEE